MQIVSHFSKNNIQIIDLSGAFRLSKDEFTEWYGMNHSAPDFLGKSFYGLSPWTLKYTDFQLS